jgi:ligand-binding sensor domain-containing protein/signal transduction histidine kinase
MVKCLTKTVFNQTFFEMNFRRFQCFIGLILYFTLFSYSHANSLKITRISTEQGLPSLTVNCQLQDSNGFIWSGTNKGLARFDGYEFIVYQPNSEETSSISSHYISALYEDSLGFLWVGTDGGGLNRFDPRTETFIQYRHSSANTNSLSHNSVNSIVSAHEDQLWIATPNGLNLFNPTTEIFTLYQHSPTDDFSLSSNEVVSLLSIDKANLWVGLENGGLNRFDFKSQKFEHFKINETNLSSLTITSMESMDKNKLLVGTRNSGFYVFDVEHKSWLTYQYDSQDLLSLSDNSINVIFKDSHQRVWIGTNNGLSLFDVITKNFTSYYTDQSDTAGLGDDQIHSIIEDESGMIWFGTGHAGISLLNPSTIGFNSITHNANDASSITDNIINALAVDNDGGLWVAGNKGLSYRKNKEDGFVHYLYDFDNPHGLNDKRIKSILIDNASNLWVGTKNGGLNFKKENSSTFKHYVNNVNDINSLSNNMVNSILQRTNGEIWISTKKGLNRWQPKTDNFQRFFHQPENINSLSDDYIYQLFEDRQNRMWIATRYGGLNLWLDKTQSFQSFQTSIEDPNSINSSFISSIFQDLQGDLWIGTVGDGLSKGIISEKNGHLDIKFQNFTSEHDIMSDLIASIVADNSGVLWLSTTDGISRFDPVTKEFTNFGGIEGAQSGGYLINSSAVDEFGRVYFGGIKGVTRFTPEQIEINSKPPKLAFTGLRLANKPINIDFNDKNALLTQALNYTKKITLNHSQTAFSFEFSTLHFTDPSSNEYAYQLVGYDKDWIYTDSTRRFASYTNLPAGEYTFNVKASNQDNTWNVSGVSLAVDILPPWWLTWWAKITSVITVISILYFSYRFRINLLTQQRQNLRIQVAERTHTITVLSEIGKEISSRLDTEKISQTVYRRVSELMDASIFGIGIYQEYTEHIEYKLAIENNIRYSNYCRKMKTKNQFAVWCIENKKPVFINDITTEYKTYLDSPETLFPELLSDGSKSIASNSLLYMPLMINERVLGIITVQSYKKNAYSPSHLDMLQTLATYVAIALENANAYHQIEDKNTEILDTQQQLVLSEKMASLGTLTAGVAHEINNPTNFTHASVYMMGDEIVHIKSLLRQLAGGDKADPEVLDSFNEMFSRLGELKDTAYEGTNRIKKIVESLRSFTHLDSSKQELAELPELISTTIDLVKTQYNTIKITTHFGETKSVSCFASKLGQVFMNIVINACQAIEEKQNKDTASFEGELVIETRELNHNVEIYFKDNGIGMTESTIAKIFEPFFTTKTIGEGTGLGMAITYGIIEEHNGTINVASEINIGTEIMLTIPV